ncbi:MAG: hypothetical protein ASARMPREDX12_003798 [Alectoria sarmentosa]|nr:MAG: hypothetical protein ASARMPREDX12_003798 [Alectoria sarmentosa]CAD6571913.1 MAG: hypothetical protein ASARMPRED_004914 [Alectoria sarmentosa]
MSDSTTASNPSQGCGKFEGQGAQLLLCLVADPFTNTVSFSIFFTKPIVTYSGAQFHQIAVFSALGYSVGTMILITLAFSIMRPHNSVVYAPKLKYADDKHAPPRIGKGMFAWFWPVASTKEPELVEKIGLDATIFLRFTRMCRNIFVLVTIVAIAILLPANIIGSKKNKSQVATNEFLTLATPQYVTGAALWVHVVCAWAINIIMAFFLWRNYAAVTRLRRQYFESAEYLTALHSRTLMLTDIPSASRTDEGILRLTDEVEQTSGLPRAAIARNVKELPELIEEHDKAVRELEGVLAKYLKNPDNLPANRPTMTPSKKYRKNNGSQKVDAIDYLTDRIGELEMEIKHVRESIDKRNPMPFGFASYERIKDAHTEAYAAKKKHPQGTTIKMAPRPNDLIWKNLPLSKKDRNWKRFINNFWIAILTIIWIAPNALTAIFLSNLTNLANIWGGFKKEFEHHSTIWSIVQGIASPALTSLVYLILPIIFRRLSIHAGDTTKTSRERHVATKLYAFFVFNNLVVFSTFSVLFTFISFVVNNRDKGVWDAIKQGEILFHLVFGLCQVSPFWLTWLLQRNLGAAADLAQVLNLTWGWFNRTFMSPTPRQTIEWTAPPAMDYAVYYNYFLFYATVALCFVTIQPLVIPVTAFYFAVDYWLKKYLLLYVLITKTESGGQYWRILFNRLLFATIFADFIIALVVKSAGTWVMIGVMAPLPLLLIGFKFYCASTFDDQNEFYTRATLKDPEHLTDAGHKTRKNDRVGTKFGHPALYSKLMTPMVHAKAQHVIGQVYRGRLNPENNMSAPMGYSDIAMDPMSRDVPGKTARFAPEQQKQKDMFEVVPESHLDFGYFKDRTDFSDEHGGDGELYGRPQDLVSERSSTPRSFMGRDGGSPSSSRASSPGPEGGLGRLSPQEPRQMNPAYRDHSHQSSAGRGNFYSNGNESERNLLSGAQSVGTTENEEQYGLDRWRTGGSGYIGVPQGEETGYDAFRGGGK